MQSGFLLKLGLPIGSIVAPFWAESYKVIPKRNYLLWSLWVVKAS